MTNSNSPGTMDSPGFGAFLGSSVDHNSGDNSDSSPSAGSSETSDSVRSAAIEEAAGDKPAGRRSAPRRRGTRGGRRRKNAASSIDEGESANASSPESESKAGSKAESKAGAATEPDRESGTTTPRTRRKRTTRGRRGSARSKSDEQETKAEETVEGETRDPESTSEAASEKQPAARKKRTRRRSTTRRKKTAAAPGEDHSTEEPPAARDDEPAETAEPSSARDTDDSSDRKKRRRRGTRGGRKRSKKLAPSDVGAAAVVEVIPGEEDDLTALPDLPELPEDAEYLGLEEEQAASTATTRKKKRTRRAAKEVDADEELAKTTRRKVAAIVPDQQILVNAGDREETRVAVVSGGRILDFQMNVESDKSLVSDIYRGRVVNIEASIGAAFIDFGRGRNGFLHTSDILPVYGEKGWNLTKLLSTSISPEDLDEDSSQKLVAAKLDAEMDDDGGEDDESGTDSKDSKSTSRGKTRRKTTTHRRPRPRRPIKDILRVGDKVVVQVTKDAIGDKGPTLTTYLSIPGRYLVLMPSMAHRGVSRKIDDVKERKRLKRILDTLSIPDGMGVIARTAASGRTKTELKRDLDYLLDAWKRFAKRLETGHGPIALYQESDVAIRTVRDLFGPETESVVVDDKQAYQRVVNFAEILMPDQVERIKLHEGPRPLFTQFGVEQDFERIFSRRIELPSGGSIVFDQAEALVAIDVNSGKTRTSSFDFEEIALKTNMDAVPEIARQIRLRDLGGILVIDFIDMMKMSNRRVVERAFRAELSGDRARSKVGRISQFGLLEMTRQRLGPGMSKKLFAPCPACRGQGRIRTPASRAAAILRRLGSSMTLKGFSTVEIRAEEDAIEYLKKEHRDELRALESKHNRKLRLTAVPDQVEDSVLRYLRADGREVRPGGRKKR